MKITAERLVENLRKFLKQKDVDEGILDDFKPDDEGKVKVKAILDKIKSEADGKTWIFFDTETTGFSGEYNQLTEVAAIAVKINMETNNSEIIGKFNKLCDLTEKTKKQIEKDKTFVKLGLYDPKFPKVTGLVRGKPRTPGGKSYLTQKRMSTGHILDMTGYFKNKSKGRAEVVSEKESIEQLDQFIKSFPNPILIIHNESFDREFIDARAKIVGASVDTTSYESWDSLDLARAVFCPVLALKEELKDIYTNLKTTKKLNKLTGEYETVIGEKPSSSLGILARALAINATEWHTAIADVTMLLNVFDKIISILKQNSDAEITATYNEVMAKANSYAKKLKLKLDSSDPAPQSSSQDSVAENKSLSPYWNKRANIKSERAKRRKGNKLDKNWAKNQQDFSSKINEKVFKLFEKELISNDETTEEVTSFLKQMKKDRRRKKIKMLEKKKSSAIPPLEHPKKLKKKRKKAKNPYSGEKKSGKKFPYEGSRNGFLKTLNKRIKKAGGHALPVGVAYGGASMMEEESNVPHEKRDVKSEKKNENKQNKIK